MELIVGLLNGAYVLVVLFVIRPIRAKRRDILAYLRLRVHELRDHELPDHELRDHGTTGYQNRGPCTDTRFETLVRTLYRQAV